MIRINGLFAFTPAELGFNALAIGAGVTTDGQIISVPEPCHAFTLVFTQTGTSSMSVHVQFVDVDGVTVISSSNSAFWTALTTATTNWGRWGPSNFQASGGSVQSRGTCLLDFPFLRFSVQNAGAVSNTVTLRAFFHRQTAVPAL